MNSLNDDASEQDKFEHSMLREIWAQPEVIEQSILDKLDIPVHLWENIQQINIVACGTSKHAGLVGKYWIEQLAGIPTTVESAFEWADAPPPLVPGTVIIGVSQSGETADVKVALEMENQRRLLQSSALQSKIILITNYPNTSLEKLADHTIQTKAGIEQAIAATKSFSAQLIQFLHLAINLASYTQKLSPTKLNEINENLKEIPDQIQDCLLMQNKFVERLRNRCKEVKGFIYLGSGINYPIALEGALKLKETNYIYAEGFSSAEFRHGPIAMLEEGVPVIAIAIPGSSVYNKVIATVQEVKARGAYLIGVTPKTNPDAADLFDELLPIPDVDDLLSPLLSVIPLQVLAYSLAVYRGLNVDEPRYLSKAVTT